MEKTFYILLGVLLSLKGFSQNKFSFGFRTSISYSKSSMGGNYYSSNAFSSIGFSEGMVAELSLVKSVSIRAELAFVKKKYSYNVYFTDALGNMFSEGKISTSLYYMDLPLLVKLSAGKKVRPYLLLGGWAGLFLTGVEKYPEISFGGASLPQYYSYSNRPIQLGVITGPGLDIGMGKNTFFMEVRPCIGLLSDNYGGNLTTWDFGAGIRF